MNKWGFWVDLSPDTEEKSNFQPFDKSFFILFHWTISFSANLSILWSYCLFFGFLVPHFILSFIYFWSKEFSLYVFLLKGIKCWKYCKFFWNKYIKKVILNN